MDRMTRDNAALCPVHHQVRLLTGVRDTLAIKRKGQERR